MANKKKIAVAVALLWSAGCYAQKAEQVWRYADEKTGQVVYSNVQIKGKKGERVEVMAYPPAVPMRSQAADAGAALTGIVPAGNAPSPIPDQLLRQIQAASGGSARPPAGLPPLPAAERSVPSVKAGLTAALPTLPGRGKELATAKAESAEEPSWAKTKSEESRSPGWAKDPFSQ